MIHVEEQPEPPYFDIKVRQPGLAYLKKHSISLDKPLVKDQKLDACWRYCLDDLYTSYKGCCAYLALFFERVTGSGSVDHFLPKSKRVDMAYEWKNYRLACSRMNSRKNVAEDILDPFELQDGWFHLVLVTGWVFPSPALKDDQKEKVQQTIDRLKLNDPRLCNIRARHFRDYIERKYTADYLKDISPFVWFEAHRQNLFIKEPASRA